MQTVTIDLIPQKEKPIVKLSQYDNDRQVRFMLEENGETYTLDGTETVEVNIRKPDRNIVVIAPEIDANAYVDVLFTEQSAACFGESFGELSIKSGETVIGTCNFIINVEISPIYGGIDSATEINNLTTQVEEIVTEVLSDNYYTKTETNDLLDAKANASDVYTKTQTDNLLDAKANASDVYTKTQTDTLLDAKANASDVYTKTQTDNLLDAKANASDVYTKTQTDNLLDAKANASDVYTKTQVDGIILDLMPVDNSSGAIANFETGLAADLVECKCYIVATGGNGTPSTPIAINGYTEANITRCGVNFINNDNAEIGTAWNGSPNSARARLVIPCEPSTNYVLNMNGTMTVDGVYFGESETIPPSGIGAVTFPKIFTTASTSKFITLGFNKTNIAQEDIDGLKLQLEFGSTPSNYSAYNGNTYTIAFGQTVYGGVLDVKRGELTVTHGGVDLSTLDWTASTYGYRTADLASDVKTPATDNIKADIISEAYNPVARNNIGSQGDNNIAISTSGNILVSSNSTPTGYAVYELATPFDIDLTPVQIRALVGENNIYNDTNGNTEVKFKDSIQHYIDSH